MSEDLGTCTMCERAPATEIWFAPVCAPCGRSLDRLDVQLTLDEIEDPELGRLRQNLDDAWNQMGDP